MAVQNLQSDSILDAASGIMTTDRFPKIRSMTLSSTTGNDDEKNNNHRHHPRVVGIAKGAGMIEPNMATMLSYILTDAKVSQTDLRRILKRVVDETFNCLSVDGDESTSDMVVCMASNQIGPDDDDYDDSDASKDSFLNELEEAILHVCKGLASDIVRNGEGTSHVMRVKINNFPGPADDSRDLGRFICNSNLFKCAVTGNDPNVGRLAAAIGSYMGKQYKKNKTNKDGIEGNMMMMKDIMSNLSVSLGGYKIFNNGKFTWDDDDDDDKKEKNGDVVIDDNDDDNDDGDNNDMMEL